MTPEEKKKRIDEIHEVLKEIQESVPQAWRDMVFSEKKKTPDVEFVVERALEDPDFPEEKKEHLRLLQRQGIFSKADIVENPVIAKKIDSFVKRKMNEAVKGGRLPNKKEFKKLTQK